jgi:hypothetical protein
MLGDMDPVDEIYANYFKCEAHPDLSNHKDICVGQVEIKAREHLDRQCLGSPLLDNPSVESIVSKLLINQGCLAT